VRLALHKQESLRYTVPTLSGRALWGNTRGSSSLLDRTNKSQT